MRCSLVPEAMELTNRDVVMLPPAALLGTGEIERQSRVSSQARGTVTNPLTRDEHGHAAVELELHHLARRRVHVAAQVAQQPPRQVRLARPVAIAHARRPLD